MSLKTDYKNDKFPGKRKYQITQNADNTVSLDDVTQYETVGDIFNADDINATNMAVNETVSGFGEVRAETEKFQSDVTKEFNSLKQSIDKSISDIKGIKTAKLTVAGWSSTAPYIQTISVSGMVSTDTPVIGLYLSGEPSADTVKAQRKAYGYLDRAVTGNGNIKFYCYEKKPASDFTVSIKGE